MYFYLQDSIASSNFIKTVNFSGISPFKYGWFWNVNCIFKHDAFSGHFS